LMCVSLVSPGGTLHHVFYSRSRADKPAWSSRAIAGGRQFGMVADDSSKNILLRLADVYKEIVPAGAQILGKAFEVRMRLLYPDQASLPGTETQHNNGKKNRRNPGDGVGDPGRPRGQQNQGCADYTDHGAAFGAVDNVLAQDRFHV